jgi:hypothetical protein
MARLESVMNTKRKLAIGAGIGGLVVSASASAASVLTQDMTDALTDGFTALQDTVGDVISVVWPFVLGVAALYAAPTIVKKLWNMATR